MSCGVGHRHSLDLVLLWLWYRPAAAAPIRTLAWESLYATGSALKNKTKKKDYYKDRYLGISGKQEGWFLPSL